MQVEMTVNQDKNKAKAFREFRDTLAAEGFYECRTTRVILEMMLFVLLTFAGIWIVVVFEFILLDALGMLLVAVGSMGVSTNTHMWSHGASSRNRKLSQFMTYFGYPFFLQLSAVYWRNKHIVVHHPNPNVIGVDDDATLAPFFSLTKEEAKKLSGLRSVIGRYQGMIFPFAIVLNAFGVIITGWIYLIKKMWIARGSNPAHWLDLFFLTLHYIFWMVIPCFFFAVSDVLLFTLCRFSLISYGLFALFAPAHYPAEAVRLDPNAMGSDRVYLQAATTVNFSTGWFGRLLCAGVDYQIEHHLFPSICHTRCRELSPLVQKYFEQQGYPYRTLGWWEAIVKSARIVASPNSTLTKLPEDSSQLLHLSRQ